MVEIWHVRHGQRADEVSGREKTNFKTSTAYHEGRYYDTTLTRHGHIQASKAGRFLASLPFNQRSARDSSGFDRVHCSPLLRAVQTAFCIAHQLGGLPLQVVPGLGSCTAALVRIGYDDAITMSDEDIRDAFPGISLLPRDPTAPTSFDGACAWLAARETRARVLCVGHREGTKGMAGKRVPTPHCCIAIFEAKRGPETTYMLKDLLDKEGIPLGHGDGAGSPFARVRSEAEMPGNVDDTGESVLAGLLEVLPPLEHPEAFLTGDRWLRRSMKTASALQAQRASNQPSRVPPKQRVATRGATQTKHHSGERKKSGGRRQQRPNALAQCLRQNRSNDGKAEDDDHARGGQVVAHHPTGDNGGGGGAGGPVRLTGSRSTAYPDSTSAGSTAESSGNNDSHGRCSERGNSGTGAKGKPAAGGGFRVAALARSSVGGATYKLPKANTLLGISSDALAGSAGVLSFLNARELCVSQLSCKALAKAANESEYLWRIVYTRLPKRVRDHTETATAEALGTTTAGRTLFKDLFVSAIDIMLDSRSSRATQKVAQVRRRLSGVHALRPSVDALKTKLSVRLGGKPVKIVDSIGTRIGGWVSRGNVLSQPSTRNGMRMFSLSSSVKVELPSVPPSAATMTASQASTGVRVALSTPSTWLAGATLFKTSMDSRLVMSKARFLGRSRDEDSVALYEILSSDHNASSNNKKSDTKGVEKKRTVASYPPALTRGCLLLGVLGDRLQQQQHANGIEADTDVSSEAAVGFLSVHLPHQLVLDASTRRPTVLDFHGVDAADTTPEKGGPRRIRKSLVYGDDSAGPAHGLENLSAAIGLRTVGVAAWETKATGVTGRLRLQGPQSLASRPRGTNSGFSSPLSHNHSSHEKVVCIDLVRPGGINAGGWEAASGARAGSALTLSTSPQLPFSTSGGLSGVFEDVLLTDFYLCDEHGDTMWAFTAAMVFGKIFDGHRSVGGEDKVVPATTPGDDVATDDCTQSGFFVDVVDIAHSEVRRERRRGVIEEPGVGRVIVELALINSSSLDDNSLYHGREGCSSLPAAKEKAEWMVRLARAELDLGFFNAWFGTNHG